MRIKSILTALTLLMTSCGHARAEVGSGSNTIKIGFVTSLTGVAAQGGQDMIKGLKCWQERVKNKVAGKNIEIIVENDESSPATAMARIKKLVDVDKVDIIDGFLLAHIAKAAIVASDKSHVPVVAALGGAEANNPKEHPWAIHSSATPGQQTLPFGAWAYNKLKYKRVATLGLDYAFGYEVVAAFQKTFEDAGGQVVQRIWAPLGFQDFSSFLKEVRSDVDAVYICSTAGATRNLGPQLKLLPPKLPILAFGSGFDESVVNAVPGIPTGIVSSSSYCYTLNTADNKRFVAEFNAQNQGADPGTFAESTYNSLLFIQKAIESLKGDVSDKAKFMAVLRKTNLKDSTRGPIKMDEYGNPMQNIYVRILARDSKGKLKNKIIHTFPNVAMTWTYPQAEFLNHPPYSKEYPPCTHCGK